MSEQNSISPDLITASPDASADWKNYIAEALTSATPREVLKDRTLFHNGDELLLKASSLSRDFDITTTLDPKPEKRVEPTINEQKIQLAKNMDYIRDQVISGERDLYVLGA